MWFGILWVPSEAAYEREVVVEDGGERVLEFWED